jgi:Zn-dependent oligopeptidase
MKRGPLSNVATICDSVSNEICKVAEPADFCMAVRDFIFRFENVLIFFPQADRNPKWRRFASQARQITNDYFSQLNTDVEIYHLLKSSFEQASEKEEKRILEDLINDLQREGVDLQNDYVRFQANEITRHLEQYNMKVLVLCLKVVSTDLGFVFKFLYDPHESVHEKEDLLLKIAKTRAEKARLLGYNNYSDYELRGRSMFDVLCFG